MSEPGDEGSTTTPSTSGSNPTEGSSTPQSRRDVLNLAIAGTASTLGAMSAYPVLQFLSPAGETERGHGDAGEEETFPRGSARTILLGSRPALVIRLEDGAFRAYSALCTHLQCLVVYSPERKRIECPCHRGLYSLEGLNVAGPPPAPLKPLTVAIVNGKVIVTEV